MKKLTAKQKTLLDVIAAFNIEKGYPPTYNDIGRLLGCSGVNCFKMLKTIKKNGLLPEEIQDNKKQQSFAKCENS